LPRGLGKPLGAFCCWLVLVEAGVAVWSHSGVVVAGNAARWSVTWPVDNSTLKRLEPDRAALQLLHYDDAQQAQWSEADGTRWSAFYFNWLPGRAGAYLAANRHSPEICMTYAGWEMRAGPDRVLVQVKGLHLPFRRYSFALGADALYVFHCRWEPAFEINPALLEEQGIGTTLRGFRGLSVLWSARGKGGQKILELVVQGCATADEAQAALVHQLERIITVEPSRQTTTAPRLGSPCPRGAMAARPWSRSGRSNRLSLLFPCAIVCGQWSLVRSPFPPCLAS
jgi:hypothetical protein